MSDSTTLKFDNCNVSVGEDGLIHITIDPKQSLGMSASGKSSNIGSTRGNKPISVPGIGRPIMLGVNCYQPR